MKTEAKNIVIVRAGESGVGAALLAQQKGANVFLSDRGQINAAQQAELDAAGIAYESGQHTLERIFQADEVIKSPGIPDNIPMIKELVAKGIPVIGEIEYAARYTPAKLLAITGSNGKTTTTLLVYHILKELGYSVGLGGNIGTSLARQIIHDKKDRIISYKDALHISKHYKNSKLIKTVGFGHGLKNEQVYKHILEFLNA